MSKIKTFQIVDDMGEEGYSHDYDVTVEDTDEGTLYTMYRSKNHFWNEDARGEKVMSVLDNGDGYTFSPRVGKELDYAEGSELYAILAFINSQSVMFKGHILETNLVGNI